jgi:hypothetical protein
LDDLLGKRKEKYGAQRERENLKKREKGESIMR